MGWFSLRVDGPLAGSVSDLAYSLAAIAGPDPPSSTFVDEPRSPFAGPLDRDFQDRVAGWKDLGGLPVDPRVREVVDSQRRVFEALGCIVEEAEPDFSGAVEIFQVLRCWQVYLAITGQPLGGRKKAARTGEGLSGRAMALGGLR
jgi:amidase